MVESAKPLEIRRISGWPKHISRRFVLSESGKASIAAVLITALLLAPALILILMPSRVEVVAASPGTFGYTGEGGTAQSPGDRITGSVFTITEDGTADEILAFITGDGDSFKAAIYTHNNGTGTLVTNGVTDEEVIEQLPDPAWKTFTFSTPPSLTASTEYILVIWSDGLTGDDAIYWDDGDGSVQGHYDATSYNGFPSPTITWDDHEDRKYSIYCSYTAAPSPVKPTQPTLYLPSENSTTNDNTPYFEWTLGENADNHRLLVDNDNDFSSPIENRLFTTENSYFSEAADSYPDNENYWYKVMATNENGDNESSPWRFEISGWITPPSVGHVCGQETGFENTKAIDDNTDSYWNHNVTEYHEIVFDMENLYAIKKIRLYQGAIGLTRWGVTSGLTVWVSTDNQNWGDSVCEVVLNAAGWQENGNSFEKNGRYIRVISKSDYASQYMFEFQARALVLNIYPTQPQLYLPENENESIQDNTPTFEWILSENADNYRLLVDSDSNFSTPDENRTLTDNTYTIGSENSLIDENYYWKVIARNENEKAETSSVVWSFTVNTRKAHLYSPENENINNDNTPTFEWILGTNVDNSRLFVDNDADFSSPEHENVTTGNTFTIALENALPRNEKYYWKVVTNGTETSDIWNFFLLLSWVYDFDDDNHYEAEAQGKKGTVDLDSDNFPTSTRETGFTTVVTEDYLISSDNIWDNFLDAGETEWSAARYTFEILEDNIENLEIIFEGHSDNHIELYIWDNKNLAWDLIDNFGSGASDNTIIWSITTDTDNYVDSDDHLWILAGTFEENLSVDYVACKVNGGIDNRAPIVSVLVGAGKENAIWVHDVQMPDNYMEIKVLIYDHSTIENVVLEWYDNGAWENIVMNDSIENLTNESYYYFENVLNLENEKDYSFNIWTQDRLENGSLRDESKEFEWSRTDNTSTEVRKYIRANYAITDNLLYAPFYLWRAWYPVACYAESCLDHEQAPDGSVDDTGYLQSTIPTTFQERFCGAFLGFWMNENMTIEPDTLIDNIYVHIWWATDDNIGTMAYGKDDGSIMSGGITDSYIISEENAVYGPELKIGTQPGHYLEAKFWDVTDLTYNSSDIYQFQVGDPTTDTDQPNWVCSREYNSYIILNVPDNSTLQGMDSDEDGWSDYKELYENYTNPFLADTDDDNLMDSEDSYPLRPLRIRDLTVENIDNTEVEVVYRENEHRFRVNVYNPEYLNRIDEVNLRVYFSYQDYDDANAENVHYSFQYLRVDNEFKEIGPDSTSPYDHLIVDNCVSGDNGLYRDNYIFALKLSENARGGAWDVWVEIIDNFDVEENYEYLNKFTVPAEWSLIETWIGDVEAPIIWQLVETWTGTLQSLAPPSVENLYITDMDNVATDNLTPETQYKFWVEIQDNDTLSDIENVTLVVYLDNENLADNEVNHYTFRWTRDGGFEEIGPDPIDGSGTPEDPYIITTVEQLQEMNDNKLAHYALGNDIDASDTVNWNDDAGFVPVGINTDKFRGGFDGQGYVIENLFINRSGTNYVGLYGYIGSSVVIENVGLVNENISGYAWVGGLIGDADSSVIISNSYSTGSVSATYNGVGGLVGVDGSGSTISNSYSTCSVTGNDRVGGLIGANYGTVSKSYSAGSVSGTSDVGGLVGYNNATVSNSFYDNQTSGQSDTGRGTPKSTAEMKTLSTFSGAGWDIVLIGNYVNETWYIDEGNDYPKLGWPAKPVLSSPGNASSTKDRTTYFEWENSTENSRLLIDDDSDFSTTDENRLIVADNSYTIPRENSLAVGTYYWKVRDTDNDESAVWQFTIEPFVHLVVENSIAGQDNLTLDNFVFAILFNENAQVTENDNWDVWVQVYDSAGDQDNEFFLNRFDIMSVAEWNLLETWTGTVDAPVAWQEVESWTGTIEAPAAWQLIETWSGSLETPVAWQLIETWTGAIQAPSAWQLIETWSGTVEAPVQWSLIEEWSGTVQAPSVWTLVETWSGTVEALAQWQLMEGWSGAIEFPSVWNLIETWTGTVIAPVEWNLIEEWSGTVQAPTAWQLVESWSGTVEAPSEWQQIESWTGTIEALSEWTLTESWTGEVDAPTAWILIESWSGTIEAPSVWQLIETWTGTVEAPAEWQLIETWDGTIITPSVAVWNLIESWTGSVEASVAWQLTETWSGTVQAPTEWILIESWTGAIEAPTAWQLIETWGGTIQAPAVWVLVESWTGMIQTPAVWVLIETWTGSIEAPSAWQLLETWSGVVEVPAGWWLMETWTGTVEAYATWQLLETWSGSIEAPVAWQLLETWAGSIEAPSAWQLLEIWTGTIEAPTAWQLIETWSGNIQAPSAWSLLETWTGTVTSISAWQLLETWTGTVRAVGWNLIETWIGTVHAPGWYLFETWTGDMQTPTVFAVSVSITPSENSGTLGGTLTYTVTVVNIGGVTDNYDLTSSDPEGWSTYLDNDNFYAVASGDNYTTTLNVALSTTGTHTITVTAASQGDVLVSGSDDCTVISTTAPDVVQIGGGDLALALGMMAIGLAICALLVAMILIRKRREEEGLT